MHSHTQEHAARAVLKRGAMRTNLLAARNLGLVILALATACSVGGRSRRSANNGGGDGENDAVDMRPAASPDLATAPDFKPSPDLATAPDFKPSPDLATAPDLTPAAPQAPIIFTFYTLPGTAYDGQRVDFIAEVTHPLGAAHLTSVQLFNQSGTEFLADLPLAGTPGVYSQDFLWTELDLFDFTTPSLSTGFVVKAFDAAGHVTTATTTVYFLCSSGLGAVNGVCKQPSTVTPAFNGCYLPPASASCESICFNLAKTCVPNGCGGYTIRITSDCDGPSSMMRNGSCATTIAEHDAVGDGIYCCCAG